MIRRGFTLLEVLVVVGIIAVLSTMLVIGINHMKTSGYRQQTALLLENMRSMYADWDGISRRHFPTANDQLALTSNLGYPPNYPNYDMPCPENMTSGFVGTPTVSADRTGYAVLFTRDIMKQLRSTPSNAVAMTKMSPSSLMRFIQSIPPVEYAAGTGYPMLARVYTEAPQKVPGEPQYDYVCLQYNPVIAGVSVAPPIPPSPTTPPPAPDPKFWLACSTVYTVPQPTPPVLDDTNQVPLDAWGNPLIFVSSGSLGASPASYTNLDSDGNPPLNSGGMTSGTRASAIKTQVRSPDGRPFWASAGPDGDFSKGDDNLYSFER